MQLSFCINNELNTSIPFHVLARLSLMHGHKIRRGAAIALVGLLGVLNVPAHAADPAWTIKDVGTLGQTSSEAGGVNELGQVTGASVVTSGQAYHAYVYKNGALTDISASPEWINLGRGINNAGQVVGYTATSWSQEQVRVTPFLYKDGVMTVLGDKPGGAAAINNRGVVVGGVQPGACCTTKGFIYKDGVMKLLGTLGGNSSAASAINDVGQVAGVSDTKNFEQHAFLYSNGRMSDLGTLGGTYSTALGINDKGHVVGESWLPNLNSHAFLYSGGRMHDLGTLGSTFSRAYDINNAGQVVGLSSTAADPTQIPFLFTNGKMVAINSLPGVKEAGWVLFDAVAINNAGQIVGRGNINGQQHAYLLSPPARKCGDDRERRQNGERDNDCNVRNSPFGRP